MAVSQIFRDSKSNIVLVPWARHPTMKGPNVASGKSIQLTTEEFLSKGTEAVRELLVRYDIQDGNIPSELYEDYSESKRSRFLAAHKMLMIIHNDGENIAWLSAGGTIAERIDVAWPLDAISFPPKVMKAFDEI
jgi:hypothetical protein